MNILITGRPGSGKSTLVRELAERAGERAGGFYTEEIHAKGRRVGFRIITLDGKRGNLAGTHLRSSHHEGRYGVCLKTVEKLAIPAIEDALTASKTVLIDKIGPMELLSEPFSACVLKALEAPNTVVATLSRRGPRFIRELKARDDIVLLTLTPETEDEVRGRLLDLVQG